MLAKVEIALADYSIGEFCSAEAILSEALAEAGDDTALRARVLAELSGNCVGSDNLQGVARWAELAATESTPAGPGPTGVVSLVRSLRFRGRGLVLQGQLQEGLRTIQRSVDLCRGEDAGDLEMAWSLYALGQGYGLQGQFDQALRLLGEAEALAHGSRELLSSIWSCCGTSQRDAGAFDQAEVSYQRSGRTSALREMAFLHLRQDRGAEALELAEEALRYSYMRENPSHRHSCQAVHGIVLAMLRDRRAGLQELAGAVETLRQRGRAQQLASAQWHLARLLVEDGQREEGLEHLHDAVTWAATHGVYHFWWWDPRTIARLWPSALGSGWAPEYLFELARLRLGPEECRFLYDALDAVPRELRPRLVETLELVSAGSTVVRDTAADLLRNCHDAGVRRHISEALASGVMAPRDLACLRGEAGLTWKEIEILILYYLATNAGHDDHQMRRQLAGLLGLSEQTLKVHIRSVRRKLDLGARRRGSWLPLGVLIQGLQGA